MFATALMYIQMFHDTITVSNFLVLINSVNLFFKILMY